MAKYRLLSKAGYPERGFVEGKVYDEDEKHGLGGTTIRDLAEEYPEDWELVNDVPKNRIEGEPTPYIETSFPRASQAGWIEDPIDGKLKNPTKPIMPLKDVFDFINQSKDKYIYSNGTVIAAYDVPLSSLELDWFEVHRPTNTSSIKHQDPFTPSALYNYMAENHNVTLLGSEESVIRDIVLTDIKSVKQQAGWLVDPTDGLLKDPTKPTLAEIILQAKTLYGVDLVTKPADETEIVFEIRHHKIVVNSDTLLIRDKTDHEAVSITREDFDMIAARSKEIPANYEQERKG
jgi:hypothetical protein